jgi:hypothetical protein
MPGAERMSELPPSRDSIFWHQLWRAHSYAAKQRVWRERNELRRTTNRVHKHAQHVDHTVGKINGSRY